MLFTLAPATRWGYFVYPAALLGFVSITRGANAPWGAILRHPDRQERQGVELISLTATPDACDRLADMPLELLAATPLGTHSQAHGQPVPGFDSQLAPVAPVIAET
jgi:hypothetical protein